MIRRMDRPKRKLYGAAAQSQFKSHLNALKALGVNVDGLEVVPVKPKEAKKKTPRAK